MTLTNSLSPSYRHMLCYSGMFYIITGKVGWAAYLNWKQIRTMLAAGMQIGSHTVHHVDMGSLLMYSTALAQHELQASQAVLQNHLGIAIQQFCYPLRRAIPQWHPLGPTANRILASSRPLRRRHNRSRHIWHHPA
jgi:peptidoglycan/xylan/chitin deacetylase (PgdA/CDA1 family)